MPMKFLENETTMFEKYLKRVDPKDIGLQQAATQGPTQPIIEPGHRGLRKRSRSRGPSLDRYMYSTQSRNATLPSGKLEELRDEIEKLKDESEKILDNFRAVMEEADIRSAEVKKASYEFERDIVKGAVNQDPTRLLQKDVTRYIEDKLRARDTTIEKLRLKNSTLKVHKRKLHMQLKQKEEMGEVLHEVDFNQLKLKTNSTLKRLMKRIKIFSDSNLWMEMYNRFLTHTRKKITHIDNGVLKIKTGDWTKK
ncbi:hypothetical protein OS493_039596 [Desmophyllum pertusum]|uniref:Cilia- and flagella-associated protein 263 n=1 Tax=Desmophyllum pertusum TaxID=174260 RepID=A0A9X0CTP0_9CNID|nr:hypothetical protein OS493_039596 [Desmophyllum pertusum]